MKKKILLTVLALSLVLLATPLVSAVPWTHPENNEKFQTWKSVSTFSVLDMLFGDHQYIPSFDTVNKLIISWDTPLLTHEITVDGNTYQLGTDFLWAENLAIAVFYDPVFPEWDPEKLYPSETRAEMTFLYWTYDFSAFSGGIDGTLRMRLVATNEIDRFIYSLSGTGDLQNVQVKAVAIKGPGEPPIVTAIHEGIVSGWPE